MQTFMLSVLIFVFFSVLGHVKNLKLKNSVIYRLKLSNRGSMYQHSMYRIFSIPRISSSKRFPEQIKRVATPQEIYEKLQ